MSALSILEQVISSILVVILLAAWDVFRRRLKQRKDQPPQPAPVQTEPQADVLPTTPQLASPVSQPPAAARAAAPPLTSAQVVTGCIWGVWIAARMILSPLFGFIFGGLTSGILVAMNYPYNTDFGSPTMLILVLGFTAFTWVMLTLLGMLAQKLLQMTAPSLHTQ